MAWYGETIPNTTKAYIRQSKQINYNTKLETVNIAQLLQNRQHAQNPNAVNTREQGKERMEGEVRRNEGRDDGRRERGRKGQKGKGRGREGGRELSLIHI